MSDDEHDQPKQLLGEDFLARPHDGLARLALSDLEVVRAELRAALPAAIVGRLDLSVLEQVPGSFVTEELKEFHSDILFRTRLDGRDARIYVVIEHKSQGDRFALVQLLVYVALAYNRIRKEDPPPEHLPPIIPLLFTHAPEGWNASVRFQDLLDPIVREVPELARAIPSFTAILDDLQNLDDAGLKARQLGAFGHVVFAILRDGRSERLPATAATLGAELARLKATQPDAFLVVLCYLIAVRGNAAAVQELLPHLEPDVMNGAQKLVEQGRDTGRREGIDLGRREGIDLGRREMVTKQLEAKFGPLSDEHRRVLDAASSERLEAIGLRFASADSIEAALAE